MRERGKILSSFLLIGLILRENALIFNVYKVIVNAWKVYAVFLTIKHHEKTLHFLYNLAIKVMISIFSDPPMHKIHFVLYPFLHFLFFSQLLLTAITGFGQETWILDKATMMPFSPPPLSKNPALPLQEGASRTLGSTTHMVTWFPSPRYDERTASFIILHHTSSPTTEEALELLVGNEGKVSAHYLITREGQILQMVREADRAWHAGESQWQGIYKMNASSIGIELVNNGSEIFPKAQIQALLALLQDITQRNSIPPTHIIGHADIAPGRKNDPSRYFPWQILAQHGFGIWYDRDNFIMPPIDFQVENALRELGYNTQNLPQTIEAFKLHYIQKDIDQTLNDHEKVLLYNILLKFRQVNQLNQRKMPVNTTPATPF